MQPKTTCRLSHTYMHRSLPASHPWLHSVTSSSHAGPQMSVPTAGKSQGMHLLLLTPTRGIIAQNSKGDPHWTVGTFTGEANEWGGQSWASEGGAYKDGHLAREQYQWRKIEVSWVFMKVWQDLTVHCSRNLRKVSHLLPDRHKGFRLPNMAYHETLSSGTHGGCWRMSSGHVPHACHSSQFFFGWYVLYCNFMP